MFSCIKFQRIVLFWTKGFEKFKYLPLCNFDKKPKSFEHNGGSILEVLYLKRVVFGRVLVGFKYGISRVLHLVCWNFIKMRLFISVVGLFV